MYGGVRIGVWIATWWGLDGWPLAPQTPGYKLSLAGSEVPGSAEGILGVGPRTASKPDLTDRPRSTTVT